MSKKLRITLVKSPIGYTQRQKDTAKALGLHKMRAVVLHNDTPPVRGMINKIIHLVEVEEVDA